MSAAQHRRLQDEIVRKALAWHRSKHASPFSPLLVELKLACAKLEKFEDVGHVRPAQEAK